MPRIVFFCLETCFTKIKVITVSAFESGSIDRKSLTAITPVFKINELIDKKMMRSFFKSLQRKLFLSKEIQQSQKQKLT